MPVEVVDVPGQEPFTASKIENVPLPRDSRVTMETAGGGGWGDPMHRDPGVVVHDVLEGYVSREHARTIYGVVIDSDRAIDAETPVVVQRFADAGSD